VADTLNAGEKLEKGGSLTSNNGAYTLTLQDDGNLVLSADGQAVWATGTNGQDVQRAEVQTDGNFVLYTGDGPVWASNTNGKSDVKLVLQDDRNLVLYASDGAAWSSGTNVDTPPATPEAPAAPVDEPAAFEQPAEEPAFQPEDQPEPAPQAQTHTVEPGDTLWGIAERYYGDGNRYQDIANASGLDNPDVIQPGQLLTIP
jgi:nucleoid-associated protein YgaU